MIEKIILGDCMVEMGKIAPGSVDLVLCDLPYGVTNNEWDKPIVWNVLWNYYAFVCKPGAAIVLFCQQPFTTNLIQSNLNNFKYCWVWVKSVAVNFLNSKHQPLRITEDIAVFYKNSKEVTYNPQFTQGEPYKTKGGKPSNNYGSQMSVETVSDGRRYPNNLLYFAKDPKGVHPTQKPIDLCRYLVRTHSNPGDLVLDNCCGSGTSLLAAKLEGRQYIGIDINPEYIDLTRTRLGVQNSQIVYEVPIFGRDLIHG